MNPFRLELSYESPSTTEVLSALHPIFEILAKQISTTSFKLDILIEYTYVILYRLFEQKIGRFNFFKIDLNFLALFWYFYLFILFYFEFKVHQYWRPLAPGKSDP